MRLARYTIVPLLLVSACGGDDTSGGGPSVGDAIADAASEQIRPSHDASSDAAPDASASSDAPGDSAATSDASDAAPPGSDAQDAPVVSPDASDATSMDASGDALDAESGTGDGATARDGAGSDADAAASCLASLPGGAQIAGDYYIRSNGSVVNGSSSTVVLDDATGMPLVGITQIVPERFGACALRGSDGTVWCWASFEPAPGFGGNNAGGQLGNGTFAEVTDSAKFYRATRVQVAPTSDGGPAQYLDQVNSLQTGSADPYSGTVCAIRGDERLWCWGSTTQGFLWRGTIGTNGDLAYATRIALDPDGGALPVTQVTVGGRHICFLSAGNVYCWGANVASEVGTGDTTPQSFPYHVTTLPAPVHYVGAGSDVTCALASGQILCWGTTNSATTGDPFVDASICNANFCQPTPMPVQSADPDGGVTNNALNAQTMLFVGYQFVCSANAVGQLRCWGSSGSQSVPEATVYVNPNAGTGVPSGPITAISGTGTGGYNSALRYVTADGTVVYGGQKKTVICP